MLVDEGRDFFARKEAAFSNIPESSMKIKPRRSRRGVFFDTLPAGFRQDLHRTDAYSILSVQCLGGSAFLVHHSGVKWCIKEPVVAKRAKSQAKPDKEPKGVRMSVTLPPEVHEELEGVAKKQSVSLAWVVRQAVTKYLESSRPLFSQGQE